MGSTVNPQPTDAHIRISHEVHRELVRRKFSKRQRDVIDLILTLSWGCGKPSALIPELKYFEEIGIGKNHIRSVLDGLVESHVILWDRFMNVFQFNKHYDQWEIGVVTPSPKKLNDLIKINLSHASPNLLKASVAQPVQPGSGAPRKGNAVPKKGTGSPKGEPSSQKRSSVPVKGILFPKEEATGSQKGNSPVPKKGTTLRCQLNGGAGFRLSKAISKAIKDKVRTSSTASAFIFTDFTGTPEIREENTHALSTILREYQSNFTRGRALTEYEQEDIQTLHSDYGGEWLYAALREAHRLGFEKQNLAYVRGILKGYRKRGGTSTEKIQGATVHRARGKPEPEIDTTPSDGGRVPTQEELEELMQKAREIKAAKAQAAAHPARVRGVHSV